MIKENKFLISIDVVPYIFVLVEDANNSKWRKYV